MSNLHFFHNSFRADIFNLTKYTEVKQEFILVLPCRQ